MTCRFGGWCIFTLRSCRPKCAFDGASAPHLWSPNVISGTSLCNQQDNSPSTFESKDRKRYPHSHTCLLFGAECFSWIRNYRLQVMSITFRRSHSLATWMDQIRFLLDVETPQWIPLTNMVGGTARQVPTDEQGTSDISEIAPKTAPQTTIDITTLERLMQMITYSEPRGEKVRLPQPSSERSLSDAKAWKQWCGVRLRSWAGAQCEGFDEVPDLCIRTGNSRKLQEVDRENRKLAHEICNQLEDKLLFNVQPHDKRDGALLLRAVSNEDHP